MAYEDDLGMLCYCLFKSRQDGGSVVFLRRNIDKIDLNAAMFF